MAAFSLSIGLSGRPSQRTANNHVHMQVKDGLPGLSPVLMTVRQSCRPASWATLAATSKRCPEQGAIGGLRFFEAGDVLAWNHQQVHRGLRLNITNAMQCSSSWIRSARSRHAGCFRRSLGCSQPSGQFVNQHRFPVLRDASMYFGSSWLSGRSHAARQFQEELAQRRRGPIASAWNPIGKTLA